MSRGSARIDRRRRQGWPPGSSAPVQRSNESVSHRHPAARLAAPCPRARARTACRPRGLRVEIEPLSRAASRCCEAQVDASVLRRSPSTPAARPAGTRLTRVGVVISRQLCAVLPSRPAPPGTVRRVADAAVEDDHAASDIQFQPGRARSPSTAGDSGRRCCHRDRASRFPAPRPPSSGDCHGVQRTYSFSSATPSACR